MSGSGKEGFFKIKPQESWEDPDDGCMYLSKHTIVALNITPASFGHVIIFPKNQFAQDIITQNEQGNYILSDTERLDFCHTAANIQEIMQDILSKTPERVIAVYKKWMSNQTLMQKMSGCKERLAIVIKYREDFVKKGEIYAGKGNYFENRGPHSGRMISTYHTQFVPQFRTDTVETSDAVFSLLHGEKSVISSTLAREKILAQQDCIIFENEHLRAVLEEVPSSFGHTAITQKDTSIKNMKDFSLKMLDAFFTSFHEAEKKLTEMINTDHTTILAFYENMLTREKNNTFIRNRILRSIQKITQKRTQTGWVLEKEMEEKGVQEFYNGGGAFFPMIQFPAVYHFVPRYAFDREKQGTGTALYTAFCA